jgi:hypothetical protein
VNVSHGDSERQRWNASTVPVDDHAIRVAAFENQELQRNAFLFRNIRYQVLKRRTQH